MLLLLFFSFGYRICRRLSEDDAGVCNIPLIFLVDAVVELRKKTSLFDRKYLFFGRFFNLFIIIIIRQISNSIFDDRENDHHGLSFRPELQWTRVLSLVSA